MIQNNLYYILQYKVNRVRGHFEKTYGLLMLINMQIFSVHEA